MFELDEKVAVVTGAASGIGEATVRRLAAAGATPVLVDRDDAAALASELGGVFVRADVSSEADMKSTADEVRDQLGRIDVLVNNAGVAYDPAPLTAVTLDNYYGHMGVNAVGILLGIKYFSPHMESGAAIINTASICGVLAFPEYAAYTASKFAAVGITKTAAVELGPRGIRVNCICPTTVDTPMLHSFEHGDSEAAVLSIAAPLGRIAKPEEIAALVHFLCADDCMVISGHSVVVDCGITAGISAAAWEAMEDATSPQTGS